MRSSLLHSHRLARSPLTQGWLATMSGKAAFWEPGKASVASNVRRNGLPGSPPSFLLVEMHVRRCQLCKTAAPGMDHGAA